MNRVTDIQWVLSSSVSDEKGGNGDYSVAAIASALITSLVTGSLTTSVFLFLRPRFARVYVPRTFLGSIPEESQTPAPKSTSISWVRDFWHLSDSVVLNKHSVDAYLYLRFFKVLAICGLCGILLTWPIILPINAFGGGNSVQLDALMISNVTNKTMLYAHAIIACMFLASILLVIARELMFYINLRLAQQTSPQHRSRISSKVVLFTSVPPSMRSESAIKGTLAGVTRVWIPRSDRQLKGEVAERDKMVTNLEKAQIALCRRAHRLELDRTGNHPGDNTAVNGTQGPRAFEDQRPRHRPQVIKGEKVDSITWYRTRLEEHTLKVSELRERYMSGEFPPQPTVFVEFENVAAAQVAKNTAFKDGLSGLDLRFLGIPRDDIIWNNIGLNFPQRRLRQGLTTAVVVFLIIFWSIPVGLVGAISNVNKLTEQFPFLAFINDLPPAALAWIKGTLPQLLLSTLISMMSTIFRFIAKLSGDVSLSSVEMTTQSWFFAFSVVQTFLVTTISSGAANVVQQVIREPKQAAYILGSGLPSASTFYASLFIIYGFANSSKTVLNLYDFLMLTVASRFMDTTPRQQFERHTAVHNMNYGSNYPKFTVLGVIAISYSCIAPVVLGFAALCFCSLYVAFRYNLLYAYSANVDVGGHMYNRALEHLIAGVYFAELGLIGIFGTRKAFGPSAIMIIFLIITLIYHIAMNLALGRLTRNYPTFPIGPGEQVSSDSIKDDEIDDAFLRFDRRLASVSEPDDRESGSEESPLLFRMPRPRFLSWFFNAQMFRVPSHEEILDNLLSARFREPLPPYSEKIKRFAYDPPEVFSELPKVWLPRDFAGASSYEIEQLKDVVDITDANAHFDKKGKIRWEENKVEEAPIYEPPVQY